MLAINKEDRDPKIPKKLPNRIKSLAFAKIATAFCKDIPLLPKL